VDGVGVLPTFFPVSMSRLSFVGTRCLSDDLMEVVILVVLEAICGLFLG
jgi:hypothetical protein